MIDFAVHGAVARRLLGEPNGKLSNRRTLRFGSKGALAVYVDGKRCGSWRDFATGARGGVLDLVVRERGGNRRGAFEWLRDEQIVHVGDEPVREKATRRAAPDLDDETPYQTLSPWARQLWSICRPITADDPAGRYLQARGCAFPHLDGDLRWHAAVKHPCGHVGPALVALVTDVHDASRQMSLHRTWISPGGSGRKADIEQPRLLLKDHPKAGGVIRLWPDDLVTYGLGLAEGIETTLTLARVFTPVWTCLDAGNLAGFPVLRGIDSVTVATDNDPAGLAAFVNLAARWTAAGREVRRVLAPVAGDDLNDWKNQRA